MAREGSVLFRFLGDVRDLTKKVGQVDAEISGFAKRSQNVFSKSFSSITSNIGSRFGVVGQEVSASVNSMAESAVSGGAVIGTAVAAGAAVGGAAIAGLAVKGVAAFKGLADQIRSFQRVTGASAEDASRLVAIMRALNIDTTAGARAMFLLSKNIDGNAKKLTEHGIAIARNKDGSVNLTQTLFNVRDAYQAAGKGAEGNAIAAAAFGRSGAALLPILAATRDRLNEIDAAASKHHEWMSQEQIDKAKELGIAQTELSHALQGVEIELGQGVVPALTDFTNGLTHLIELSDKAGKFGGGIGKSIKDAIELAIPGALNLKLFGKHTKDAGDAAKKAAAPVADLADSTGELGDEAASASDGLVKAKSAIDRYNDSLDASFGARMKLSAAQRALGDAEKQYDEDLKGTAATAKSFEDQMSSTFDSVVDVDEAQIRARDSARALGDALKEAGQGSEDAAAFMKRYYEGTAAGASDKGDRIREAADQAVKAAEAEVDAMAKSGQIHDDAGSRKAALRDRLIDLEKQYPAVKGQIDEYLASLARVPNASTEAEIASKKLGDAKKDLAKDSDAIIQAAHDEADAQDTLYGKYSTFLSLLEGIKKKYPEMAGAAIQAAKEATAAWESVPTNQRDYESGAAASRLDQSLNGSARSTTPAPRTGFLAGPLEAVQRVVTNNNTFHTEIHGITDLNAAAEVFGRKVAWAIMNGGR